MTDEVDRIAAIADPFELLRQATVQMAVAQQEVTELSRLRRRVVQNLHESGLSYAQIAERVGLTRGRIHQIRHNGPPPEGAFLGAGRVVIVTPLREEPGTPRPVLPIEDVVASQQLADLARGVGVEPLFDNVTTTGAIDLNRPDLVVVCPPWRSEPVARLLATDPHLRFEQTDDGPWTLVDRRTGTVYRSGPDRDPPVDSDVAYLGRLPRPDGGGSVLVIAGLRPAGTLGAVHLVCTRLAELHAEVRTDCFSVLVGTDYEPLSNDPRDVELITPFYRPTGG